MKKILVLAILVLATPLTAAEDPAKLLEQNVSVNFEEASLTEVLAMFSAFTKVDITLDVALESPPPITLALDEISAKNALDLVVALVDPKLAWDLRWGGVFVATKDRLEMLPKEVPGEAPGLGDPVNCDFADALLPEVVQFLGAFSGARISIAPAAMTRAKETAVTVRCSDTALRDALARMVFPANLALEIKDQVVWIVPAMTKRSESAEDATRRAFEENRVNLNFEETALPAVLNFLAQYADVNIHLDPVTTSQVSPEELLVTLRADDITLGNALELVCHSKGLNYDFRWGGVFVGRPDRLKVLSKATLPPPAEDQPEWERKLRKQLESPITFSFDQASALQAMEFIRTLKGVNLVPSPEARKKAAAALVTCTVNGIAVSDALALLLVPHGLKFELRNEVVLITVPE